MTLNSYFALNSVFAPVLLLAPTVQHSKNNWMKTDKKAVLLQGNRAMPQLLFLV